MNITISPRLFTKVSRYFSNPDDAFREAIQNAYRAYCPIDPNKPKPIIHIEVRQTSDKGNVVTITNEGREITNAETLLSLASSEWENDVEHDQDPAGLGVCALLAYSESTKWESAFGSITVQGEKFFNSPLYRAALEVTPRLRAVGDSHPQGTRVTMYNVGEVNRETKVRTTFCASNIIDRIKALTQFHTNVEFTLNGVKMGINPALCREEGNVAIAGYQSVVRRLSKEQWGSIPGNHWTEAGIVLVWHGNKIEVSGTELRKYLGTELAIGDNKLMVSVNSIHKMLVIVRDENVVTPKLPDRNALVWDDKTIAFLTEAFKAWAKAWLDKAEMWINLHTPDKCETITVGDYKHTEDKYKFIHGFWSEWKNRTGFDLYKTFGVTTKRGYGKRIREEIVVRFDEKKSLSLEEDGVYVLDGQGEITNVGCGGADYVGGVVFDGDQCGDGDTEDPLAEAGWYSTTVVESSHILVAVMPPEAEYWMDPKFLDKRDYGMQIHHGGTGDTLKLYAFPKGEKSERVEKFEARVKAFIADPNNAPVAEVSSLWLTDNDPGGSVVPNSTTLLSTQDCRETVFEDAANWYVGLIKAEYDDCGWDGEGSLDEYIREQSLEWEQIKGRMNGAIVVDGWGRMSDISYSVKSKVFTVDVVKKTITTPDGVVHSVL